MDAVEPARLSTRLLELADPEIEWHSFFELASPEGGRIAATTECGKYFSDLNDAWDDRARRSQTTVARWAGDVVLVGRIHYRGKASGVETESSVGWMFEVP